MALILIDDGFSVDASLIKIAKRVGITTIIEFKPRDSDCGDLEPVFITDPSGELWDRIVKAGARILEKV